MLDLQNQMHKETFLLLSFLKGLHCHVCNRTLQHCVYKMDQTGY